MGQAILRVGADIKEFNQATKTMQQQMKLVDSSFKANMAEVKNTGTAYDGLKTKQTMLTEKIELGTKQVETHKNKIATLETTLAKQKTTQQELATRVTETTKKYNEAVETYGKNSDEAKKLEGELNKLESQQKRNDNAIETTNKRLNTAKTDLNNVNVELANNEGALKKVNNELATFKIDEATKKLDNYSAKLSSFGKEMTTKVTLPIAAAGTAAGKLSIDFETGMAKINTIAKLPQGELKNLSNGILEISNDSGVAAKDLEEGFYQALSSGVEVTGDASSALAFMDSNAKLAKAGFSDLSTTVDLTTTVINAYGKSQDEVNKISDVLIKTQDLGKTTVAELGSSMGKLIPTAKGVNVEFEQTAAGMALLTKNGIATAEASTYFNSMLNEMGKSGSKVDGILREISGKSFRELMDSGKSVGEVLSDLVGYADANNLALSDLFGSVEAGKAAMVLATNGGQDFNVMLSEMEGAAGSTDAALEKIENTTGEKLKKSFNKVMNAGIKFGDVLAPVIADVADIVSDLADSLSGMDEGTRKVVVGMLAFVAAIGPVSSGLGKMTGGLSSMIKFAGKAGEQLGILKTGGETAAGGVAKLTGGIKTLLPSLGSASSSAGSATSALAGMGAGTLAVGAAIPGTLAVLGNWYEHNIMVRDGSQAVIDKSSELITKTGELNQSIQNNITERQGSLEAIQSEVDANQGLVEQLLRLNDQYGGTTQAKAAMQPVIDTLNGKIAGLNLSIDAETGKLSMTREEILKVIDSYKQQAQASEAYQQIAQNTDDLAAAEKNYQDLVANGKSIQEQQASVLQEIEGKYANVRNEQERAKLIVDEYAWRTNDLTKQQLENNKALEDAAGKVNGLRDEQSELIAQVSGEPAQAAEKVKADMYKAGGDAIQQYMDAMNAKSPELNATADQVAQNAAGTAGSETNKMTWHTVGGSLGEALGWGYWSKSPDITQKANDSVQNAENAIGGHGTNFSLLGQQQGGNYVAGLGSQEGNAGVTGNNLAQNGVNNINAKQGLYYNSGQQSGANVNSGLASQQSSISNTASNLAQTMPNAFGGIYNTMNNKGSEGGRGLANGFSGQIGSINSQFSRVKSIFDTDMPSPRVSLPHPYIYGRFSLNPPQVPSIGVRWYSEGAIFNRRTLIGVGDANNGVGDSAEAIVPLAKMYAKIERIFRAVITEGQNPENDQRLILLNLEIPVYMDGKEQKRTIVKEVIKAIDRTTKNKIQIKGGTV